MAAAERQRQVVLRRIRGVTFEAIGKQLGIARPSAFKLYKKALKLTPKANVEEMRKLEAERIADRLRGRGRSGTRAVVRSTGSAQAIRFSACLPSLGRTVPVAEGFDGSI